MRGPVFAAWLLGAAAAGAVAAGLLSLDGGWAAPPPPVSGGEVGPFAEPDGGVVLRARVEELEGALAAARAESAILREEVTRLRRNRPAAAKPADVGGFWYHSVDGGPSTLLDLRSDGRVVVGEMEGVRWRNEGWRLHLQWPDPGAPGGVWEDDCLLAEDGLSYAGRNQAGNLVRGTRKPE